MVDRAPGLNVRPPQFSNHSDEDVDHTVWDEPGVRQLAGKPEPGALTYENWLDQREQEWSQAKAWAATFFLAILSGPFAIIAAILFGGIQSQSVGYFLLECGFSPLIQEISKIALLLWVIEKRPYFFTGWFQIFLVSMISTTVFASVFNVVSHFAFPPDSTFEFVFDWTAFLGMHLVSGLLSAFGLELVWRRTLVKRVPPKLEFGYRWFISAFLVHVVYAAGFFALRVIGIIAEQLPEI